ncbi:MAG: GntR family transcriptional regulator [Spirochaetales bacterium]
MGKKTITTNRKTELGSKQKFLRLRDEELRSLTDAAYEKIKSAILQGKLPPNSRIGERQLSSEMGVSTTTIKRALGLLAVEGLVEIRPRKGTYVPEKVSHSPWEIILIRAALEGLAARFAAEKAESADLEALEQQLVRMKTCTQEGSLSAMVKANTEFHHLIHRIGRNPYITRLIQILHSFDLNFRRRALSDLEEAWRGYKEHLAVFQAIQARKAEEAEQLMKNHILRTYQQVSGE